MYKKYVRLINGKLSYILYIIGKNKSIIFYLSTPNANFITALYSVIFPVCGSTCAVLSKTSIPVMFLIVFAASLSAF
jgi:hypothetical protein